MKKPQAATATNLSTGETTVLERDFHHSTSIYQWRPIQADRFVTLLHAYTVLDENLDEFNHGNMSTHSYEMTKGATCTIWYSRKDLDCGVLSPVLLTMTTPAGKVVCFASTQFGFEAGEDNGYPDQREFITRNGSR